METIDTAAERDRVWTGLLVAPADIMGKEGGWGPLAPGPVTEEWRRQHP
jgi:hypothetical protein